ncbi:phosphopentomutase [Niameybacter massiliensis]|uniref:Phosphopentomutase n=1 Tax=Holtiella tumoricola TaxID=3018743 RepID=A0AA42DNF0_9FIRM|nr:MULTISPECIES: phosphopentomutase [Lachnospirales]MDA3732487.1 phosphopentomutase [Holtiella tumoricola]
MDKDVIDVNRVIWIVLDSVGMGAMPDAHLYGDVDTNTLGHVYNMNKGLSLPNLTKLGLGNIEGMQELDKADQPIGTYARLGELSKGKDTTTGHWEMVGIHTEVPFPTYPNGFPKEIMDAFEAAIGTKTLGNCTASGTAILDELGEEHMKTGYPIVYTSADSVFQIAAHEEIIPLEKLYEMCEIARNLLKGEHEVSRVIARPFLGTPGNFTRTPNRHDYAVTPPADNLLVYAKEKGLDVIAVGKIEDIFAGQGVTYATHTKSNEDGIKQTIDLIKKDSHGLIFTNLVDFDMKWGHRNDWENYGKGLEEFDRYLPEIMAAMKEDDLLIITADHGCDPTTPGTDHTREYVPLLAYSKQLKEGRDLGTRNSFADIGQTVCEIFGLQPLKIGESFYSQLSK